MRSPSLSTAAMIVAAAMLSTDTAAESGASRFSFGGPLPFVARKSTSATATSHSDQRNKIDVILPALAQRSRSPQHNSLKAIRNCEEEASDREARYAMQYSHERQTIRATEHAYLFHDDEFPVIPASSHKRIVRRDGPLNGHVLDV
ncbi:hypothetical protein IV203_035000 [Nitzschia inconspicua]|uniref:Uncharacterized protein n=1 Tax=Nitzschia inconspicua TaxID=303405 RepID=A0A9K3LD86_9STRA|nr:hypothetical protein IV203_035000 [Nitzschia inconspicua]